jgi:Peptidase family S41
MNYKLFFTIFIATIFFSCKKEIFETEPKMDSKTIYEYFIDDVKKHYGLFEYKGIKIDTFGNYYSKIVQPNTTNEELWKIMATQLNTLKDGHNTLYGLNKYASYDYSKFAPENGIINLKKYVLFGPAQGIIEYRQMYETSLGYINIDTFDGKKADFEAIDKAISEFSNKKGIIIDVRGNAGGQTGFAEIVAARFADKAYTYGKIKTKLGPNKNEFSAWVDTKISPAGKVQFTKPVVVLTNRKCFSSTEVFLMIMQNFPHVRIVGDTTGGGVGGPVPRELPNGWGYRLSTKLWARPDGSSPESGGIIPNYTIWNGKSNENDLILEKAIELLK